MEIAESRPSYQSRLQSRCRKIVVTGASGFVAERVIPLLRTAGLYVVGIDRKARPSSPCDKFISAELSEICHAEFGRELEFDCIMHLAAARADWGISDEEFERDNVQATKNVVQLAKDCGVTKLIFVSSISVFGQDRGTILSEENPPNPINVYGRTKLKAERLVKSCSDQIDVVIVRPTVIYGPSNPEHTGFYRATDNNIFRMIDAIQRNRFVIPGDRSVVKSVCYVENIASFLAFLAREKTNEKEFLFADEEQVSIGEIANRIKSGLGTERNILTIPQWVLLPIAKIFDLVGSVLKVNLPINSSRVRTVNMATAMEMSRAQEAGFVHPYTSKTGLEKTVDWYRQTIQGKEIDTFWIKKTDD